VGFFKKIAKGLKKDIAGGLDLLSAGFSHPIKTIKDPVSAVKQTKKEGAGKTIVRTATHTAMASGLLLGGGTAVGRKAVTKALIPKTAKGAVKATGVGLTAGGLLSASPKARKGVAKVLKDPAKLPETAFTGGQIAGKVIEGKKTPDIKKALTTGGLLGAGAVAGLGVVKGVKKVKSMLGSGQLPSKDVVGSNIPQPNKQSLEMPIGAKSPTEIPKEQLPQIDIDINLTNKQSNKRFINTGAVVTR